MFLADKQARWHCDGFTSAPEMRMMDMVAVVHAGTVRGGDLVVVCEDGTRVAAELESGSIAMFNACEHVHGSTAPVAADKSSKRLVASLYCEPRLLELAARPRCEMGRRFATWPPCPAEVKKYRNSQTYQSSAAAKNALEQHESAAEALDAAVAAASAAVGADRAAAKRAVTAAQAEVLRWAPRLPLRARA
jgi:hypothetical protein